MFQVGTPEKGIGFLGDRELYQEQGGDVEGVCEDAHDLQSSNCEPQPARCREPRDISFSNLGPETLVEYSL